MKFIPNPACERLLAVEPEMLVAMHHKAEETAKIAKSIAPVLSGDYRDGIQADSGFEHGRATGRVNGMDFKSHWIEFGTQFQPAFAVLRRAAESYGLKVDNEKKYLA